MLGLNLTLFLKSSANQINLLSNLMVTAKITVRANPPRTIAPPFKKPYQKHQTSRFIEIQYLQFMITAFFEEN